MFNNTIPDRPYVALLIAGESVQDFCDKKLMGISIRKGYRDYRTGDVLLLCCQIAKWAGPMARVTSVRHTIAEFISHNECLDNGYEDWDEMMFCLRKFPGYEDFNDQTPVTVIRWKYQ